jgi:FkbM family methyltransferase
MVESIGIEKILEIFTQKLNKKFIMGECFFHINSGDVILDIGACTGDMSLYYSWKVGDTGKVYAIEPDRTINLKRIMYIAGKEKNIYPCNCAISNKTDESILYLSRDNSHHSIRKDFLWGGEDSERREIKVKTFTLDEFVDNIIKEPKIDAIFMNVEGSELDILEGGLKTLTNMSPRIYIAPHEVDGENLKEKIIWKLEEYKYSVKEFNGLIYATKHYGDFIPEDNHICHKCHKDINDFEDMRFDGTCYGCYSDFLQEWMQKILGFK